jgi:hypothetical protein
MTLKMPTNLSKLAAISLLTVTSIMAQSPAEEMISSQAGGKATQRKILFLNFYNESGNREYQNLEKGVSDAVHAIAMNRYVYARIENHAAVTRMKNEDFFDHQKIHAIGFPLGADGIIYGKFVVTSGGIKVYGRVLSVFSKEILAEVETTILPSDDMNKEIQNIAAKLSQGLGEIFMPSDRGAVWRSALLPGWGQIYKHRKDVGYIYAGTVGTGFAFSLFSLLMWQNAYSRYRNYNPDHVFTPQGGTELIDPASAQVQFNRYASQAQTWREITLISAGITLAIYIWQIVDAWIFDTKHAQLGRRVANYSSFLKVGGDYSDTAVLNKQSFDSAVFYGGIRTSF